MNKLIESQAVLKTASHRANEIQLKEALKESHSVSRAKDLRSRAKFQSNLTATNS